MKTTFTPFTPATQYEAGSVTVTAETPAEIVAMLDDKRRTMEPGEYAEALTDALAAGTLSRTSNKPHFLVETSLDLEFMEPYFKGLESLAGCPLPELRNLKDFDLTAVFSKTYGEPPVRVWLEFGHLCFTVTREDYQDRYKESDARYKSESARFEYAQNAAIRQMKESVGYVEPIREFKEGRNGAYYPNPDYATGKRNPVQPRITHRKLFRALLEWWLENMASDLQRAAVSELFAIEHGSDKDLLGYGGGLCYYPQSTLYLPDANGSCNYGGKAPKARVIKNLAPESLKGWKPGKNLVEPVTA